MNKKSYNTLSDEEKKVIIHKGTEAPFSGKYNEFFKEGFYHCKQCNAPLYASNDKFASSCGWPSFDDEIDRAVKRQKDADGIRIELLCANCGAHLGHIFEGENLTKKNVRHCVNSISLKFIPIKQENHIAKAYFAGGCFWGVEYFFENTDGVIIAVSGYMGGAFNNPSYEDICHGDTGHLEVVEITYDTRKTNFENLAKFFFEIHDPTQINGQGPDIGEQYLSAIFFNNEEEKNTAQKLVNILRDKGYQIATKLLPVSSFWRAEEYHQDYYEKNKQKPYCHIYTKRF